MKIYSNTNDKCHVCSKGILKERITSSNLVLQYCKKCGYEGGDFYLEWGIEMISPFEILNFGIGSFLSYLLLLSWIN